MNIMNIKLPNTGKTIFFVFIAIILLLLLTPLLTIWSLNVLFPVLAIPYNFFTWLAVLWLGSVLSGGLISRSNK
jgi:hypothetical protein